MNITLVRSVQGTTEPQEIDGLMWVEIETPTGRVRVQAHGAYVTVSTPDGVLAMFPHSANGIDVAVVYSRDTVAFDGREFVRK